LPTLSGVPPDPAPSLGPQGRANNGIKPQDAAVTLENARGPRHEGTGSGSPLDWDSIGLALRTKGHRYKEPTGWACMTSYALRASTA